MKILAALVLVLAAAQLPAAFVLECTFRVQNHTNLLNVYECFTNQTFSAANPTISGIAGSHAAGRHNGHVQMLRIDGGLSRSLSFVPRDIDRYFENLIGIFIQYASLTTLHADDFDQIPNLQHVTIVNSDLATVSGRLFENTPNVTYVNLNNNRLSRVGYDLFTPLCKSELQALYFQANTCINQSGTTMAHIWAVLANLRDFCPFHNEPTAGSVACEGSEEVCELSRMVNSLGSANMQRLVTVEDQIEVAREELVRVKEGIGQLREEIAKFGS